MNILRFRVYLLADELATTPSSHDLVVMPADRMRAERASTAELPPSQRGPGAVKAHPETWVLLWLWCAATRAQLTAARFSEFSELVLDYDRLDADGQLVDDDDTDPELETVDPTQPGAGTTSL